MGIRDTSVLVNISIATYELHLNIYIKYVDMNLEDTYCYPANLTIPMYEVELIFYISIVAVDVVVHALRSEKLMMWIMIYACRMVY